MSAAAIFAIVYGVVLAALFAYGINGYVLLALRRKWRATPPADMTQWPHVVIQLPVFNERDVMARVIGAVGRLRYSGRFDVQVLDDSDDDTTALAAAALGTLEDRGIRTQLVRRPTRDGFKAGALAHGMTLTCAPLILVLDADFVPLEDFLVNTVPLLTDPDVAYVQARWGHLNRGHSRLTRGQALGIDVHFAIEQRARSAASWPVAFNGTAGLWRRAAIEDAGGWSADTLTEDLDLSYRAWLRGWRTVYADNVVCPAELPQNMIAFKVQQRRWANGSTATARKLLGRIWKAKVSLGAKLQATLHLTHYAVHPLILLSAIMAVPLGLFASPGASLWTVLPPLAMATGGPIGMAVAASAESGDRWTRRLRDVVAVVVLGTGLALSNTIAVARGLRARRREFLRTPKGGARSSYLSAGDGLGLAELMSAAVCVGISAWLIQRGIITMVPFLLLYAIGLGSVGVATLREGSRARAPSRAFPEEA